MVEGVYSYNNLFVNDAEIMRIEVNEDYKRLQKDSDKFYNGAESGKWNITSRNAENQKRKKTMRSSWNYKIENETINTVEEEKG